MMRFQVQLVWLVAIFTLISGIPRNRKVYVPGPNGPLRLYDYPGPPSTSDDNSEDEDMVMIDDQILKKQMLKRGKEDGGMVKRQAYNDDDYRWPKANGVVTIPYTSTGVDSKILQRAIEVFNAKTCVRFVPRSNQANYVKFQIGSSCNALIGNQKIGEQSCILTSSCASKKGKVLHEMMHIIGFLHEHCRPDRDSYVTIHTDRIKNGAAGNFEVFQGKDLGLPYDCDSILQYKSTAFAATSGQETITSTHCSHLGNGDTRLSLLDYKRVNKLYSCDPNPDYKYYRVTVVTDSSVISGSGTDCFIYLTLHGQNRASTEFELDLDQAGSSNLFEAGRTDTFNYMAYRNDLGSITGISVRMVSNGMGEQWWPNTFTVTDPATNAAVTFTNNKWLQPSSTYGPSDFTTQ